MIISLSSSNESSQKRYLLFEYMAKASEYRNKWIAEKLDRVNLTMPKGQKDIAKAHAEGRGESLNAFINRAITETMERDSKEGKAQEA